MPARKALRKNKPIISILALTVTTSNYYASIIKTFRTLLIFNLLILLKDILSCDMPLRI